MNGCTETRASSAIRIRKKVVRHISAISFLNVLLTPLAFAGSFGDSLKDWLLGSEVQAAMIQGDGPGLDHSAQRCITCHNGSRATHIVIKSADSPMQFSSFGKQVNHPVGMSYDSYAARKPRRYTREGSLDSNVVLVNGNVSCVSCHRLKARVQSSFSTGTAVNFNEHVPVATQDCSASGELTVGPKQSDLCIACHKM